MGGRCRNKHQIHRFECRHVSDASRLTYRINTYIGKLADFDGGDRVLNIAVPKGGMTAVQKSAFDAAANRAQEVGVTLKVTPF